MQEKNLSNDTGIENIYQQIQNQRNSNLAISRVLQTFTSQSQTELNSLLSSITQFINEFNSSVSEEKTLTGFLIQGESLIIHFIEGNQKSLENLFMHQQQFINESSVQIDDRILVYNELYFERIYEIWGNDQINIKPEIDIDAIKSEQETQKAIWNTYQKFLLAGIQTKDQQKKEGIFTPQILKKICNYLQINPQNTAYYFTTNSFTIQEFFNVYKQKILLEDQEENWPNNLNISDLIEYKENPYTTINNAKLVNQQIQQYHQQIIYNF